jgi:hypothetical protein
MRIGDAIIRDTTKVTKDWTAHQVRRIRTRGRAIWRPCRRDTVKDLAWAAMPAAYANAAGAVGMAFPRQVYYAARPVILKQLDDPDKLNSEYFTQTLLPDFVAAYPEVTAGWDLLWDDRGHFEEPHTGHRIGLGTLSVRTYLGTREAPDRDPLEPFSTRYPTHGPRHRFRHVLLVEKEGFQQIFAHAKLLERYDLAIMSSKGMNTTSARMLVEQLPGVRFLVLHDMDKAGYSILGTLTRSTRRYHFTRVADIMNLGVRLADVEAEALAAEPVHYPNGSRQNLRTNGATPEEIEFLVGGGQRVEINAFGSDALIAWLERRLDALGVAKLVPDDDTLTAAYRRAIYVHAMNAALAQCDEAARAQADAATPPAALRHSVERSLADDRTRPWDAAVADLAEDHPSGGAA